MIIILAILVVISGLCQTLFFVIKFWFDDWFLAFIDPYGIKLTLQISRSLIRFSDLGPGIFLLLLKWGAFASKLIVLILGGFELFPVFTLWRSATGNPKFREDPTLIRSRVRFWSRDNLATLLINAWIWVSSNWLSNPLMPCRRPISLIKISRSWSCASNA